MPVALSQDLHNLYGHGRGEQITQLDLFQTIFLVEKTVGVRDDGERHFVVVAEGFGLLWRPGANQDDIEPCSLQSILFAAQLRHLPPGEGSAKHAQEDQGDGPVLPEATETFP